MIRTRSSCPDPRVALLPDLHPRLQDQYLNLQPLQILRPPRRPRTLPHHHRTFPLSLHNRSVERFRPLPLRPFHLRRDAMLRLFLPRPHLQHLRLFLRHPLHHRKLQSAGPEGSEDSYLRWSSSGLWATLVVFTILWSRTTFMTSSRNTCRSVKMLYSTLKNANSGSVSLTLQTRPIDHYQTPETRSPYPARVDFLGKFMKKKKEAVILVPKERI